MNVRVAVLGLALSLAAVSGGVFAGDGDQVPPSKPRTDPAPPPAPPPVLAPDSKVYYEESPGGSKFTRFWTHTVGGSIGHGLKKGAAKISGAF